MVVISQPRGQICAVLGGIMALRMSVVGAEGVIAWGRVRDVEELRETGLPVSPRSFHTLAFPHVFNQPFLASEGSFFWNYDARSHALAKGT